MNIYVHQEKTTVPESITLKKFLESINAGHCAVLLDCEFIPSSLHDLTYLKEGNQIELITPMQGG